MFSPVAGEEELTNPGRFGQALAIWIRTQLIDQGYTLVDEPIPEDWGWVVMVQKKPFPLWVGCGNEDGSTTRWSVFVEAELSIFQKLFKKIDPDPMVKSLEIQLEEMLQAETKSLDLLWENA